MKLLNAATTGGWSERVIEALPFDTTVRVAQTDVIGDLEDLQGHLTVVYPVWNFTMPWYLKRFFDEQIEAGTHFKYTETGPEGLMNFDSVTLIPVSGGVYSRDLATQQPTMSDQAARTGIRDLMSICMHLSASEDVPMRILELEGTAMFSEAQLIERIDVIAEYSDQLPTVVDETANDEE